MFILVRLLLWLFTICLVGLPIVLGIGIWTVCSCAVIWKVVSTMLLVVLEATILLWLAASGFFEDCLLA